MRQRLGQHFLKNHTVLTKIARALAIKPGETVIEIGPGHGELTDAIVASSEKREARIILIERDPALAQYLRDKYKDTENVEIYEGNALEILPDLITQCSLLDSQFSYVLCGNIPYYLTGFLLRTIGELEHKPNRTIFTIQKEVAERITERAPRMTRLGAAVGAWATPKIIGFISRKDFSPEPEVDSATIEFVTKDNALRGEAARQYEAALHGLFQQPRKTIANNLLSALTIERAEVVEKLRSIGIDPESRPQNLDVKDIAAVSKIFTNWG
jgi:16S rRNA (adenine1518-N6/adenine1519-N6)-dimethyltransferase